jgi:HK97 family phage prohead protease
VIEPGAFAATLRKANASGAWPAMLSQHGGFGMSADDLTPVGVWTGLREDKRGLYVEGKLAPTPRGQELYALMGMQPRPAISGLSIGYIPRAVKVNPNPQPGEPRRRLQAVDLIEISPVTFPANPKSRVTAVKSARDFEDAFRELFGLSRREAKRVASAAWQAMQPHETHSEVAQRIRDAAASFINP